MVEVVSDWVEIAKTDLGVARHLSETYHPRPLEIICYHCQQAAEKAVKAVIAATDPTSMPPRSHDVSYLLERASVKVAVDDTLFDHADALTPYGVAVRYPNELFLEDRHADAALVDAAAVLSWAESALALVTMRADKS